jgi:hypothetical protein
LKELEALKIGIIPTPDDFDDFMGLPDFSDEEWSPMFTVFVIFLLLLICWLI